MRSAESVSRDDQISASPIAKQEFPQLAEALDPVLMRRVFQQEVFAGQAACAAGPRTVRSCSVDEIRYKPGQSCLISYRLQLADPASGAETQQIISVRLRRSADQARAAASDPRRLTAPTHEINDPALLVWLFPKDQRLRHLPALFDSDRVRSYLERNMQAQAWSGGERIRTLDATVIHYLPERSCIVRYDLTLERAADKQCRSLAVFGKNYLDEQGHCTFSAMQALHEQWGHGAQPLGYDAATNTLWQYGIAGEPLTWSRLWQGNAEEIIKRVAGCAAGLHDSDVACQRSFTTAEIVADLQETITISRSFDSADADRVSRLVARLLQKRNQIVSREGRHLLHRDLKLLNFMLGEPALHLIDLDTLAWGERLSDVGSFIANLHLCALRTGDDPARCRGLVAAFVEAYARASGSAVLDWRWQWYTAAALIHEVVRRSLRQRQPERLALLADFLDLAEGYLQEVEQSSPVQSATPEPAAAPVPTASIMDAPSELLMCLDPGKVCEVFARSLPECVAGHWRILRCQIDSPRYKTYRRPESRVNSFLKAVYRLTGVREDTGVEDTRLFAISAYLGQRADHEYSQIEAGGADSIGYIRELGLIYRRFPSDPTMPWLMQLADPVGVLDCSPLGQVMPKAAATVVSHIEIVNYRPGVRCTLRYDVAAAGPQGVPLLYAKTYAEPTVSAVYERIVQVYEDRLSPGAFTTARVVRVDERTNCIWQESLSGAAISARQANREQIRSVATGLARLHGLNICKLPDLTQDGYLQEALKKLDRLQRLLPHLHDELALIRSWLVTAQPTAAVNRTLHGDFHLAQLLELGGQTAVFDFDEFQHGDVLIDLANFLADIHALAGVAAAERWQEELLPTYVAAVRWPVDPQAFCWHLVIQHLTRAYRTLVQQHGQRRDRVAATVAAALAAMRAASRETTSSLSKLSLRRSP